MLEADTVVGILTQLKAMGIQIAIDDFGTGFSSLSYFTGCRSIGSKIDRAFVRTSVRSAAAVPASRRPSLRLGQSLGLSIIAEGIETGRPGAGC